MERQVAALTSLKDGCCTEEFLTLLLDLVQTAWEEQRVPRDWLDAILTPISKKGDLIICDNWRGISLLEVVGKVVARILQERLQQVAENELIESQCGFHEGRGCSDMIFTLSQLVEKSVERQSKQFITLMDLKKVYGSVAPYSSVVCTREAGRAQQCCQSDQVLP